jgi:hypothetical protein
MRLLLAYTAAVTAVTAAVPPATLASTQDGALWRIPASALVSAAPAFASIAGLLVVGVATLAVAGPRVTATAAVVGHVGSTLVLYAVLELTRTTVPTLDYGTSAIIAAWIGVLASALWRHGMPAAAFALVVVSALIGWACKGQLTMLDWEHAIALAVGCGTAPTMGAWAGRWKSTITLLRSSTKRPSTASTRG